jgi:acyl-ACP thioesterase
MQSDFSGHVDDDKIFRQSFRLSSINCNRYNESDLIWYLQIIQEIAATHSTKLNLGSDQLEDKGLEWVILRNIINVDRYVKWGEIVHLETWAHEKYKLFFPRTIIGYDDDGNKLFESTSFWAMLNRKRNFRPIPPKPYLDLYGYPSDESKSKAPEYPNKICIDEDLKLINSALTQSSYDDIDVNYHTNNISYVKWLNNLMDDDFRRTHKVLNADISWMQQTYEEDKNEVRVYSKSGDLSQSLFKYDIEKENIEGKKDISCIACMEWELKEKLL